MSLSLSEFIAACLASALIAGSGAWMVNGWRLGKQIESNKADYSANLKSISDAAVKQAQDQLTEQQAKQKLLADQDAKLTSQLQAIQDENKTLSANVAAGTQRVRIQANLIATLRRNVPNPSGTTSSVDDTTVDLTPVGGQIVLDLRSAVANDNTKILGLQQYIREQCTK